MKVALVVVRLDHKILPHKLEYYGICYVCNGWFKSYLSNHKQFVSINGYNSDNGFNASKLWHIQQCSVLGPLLLI